MEERAQRLCSLQRESVMEERAEATACMLVRPLLHEALRVYAQVEACL